MDGSPKDDASRLRQSESTKRRWSAQVGQEWADFPTLPGSHLSFRHTGWRSWAPVAQDGSVWASCRGGFFSSSRATILSQGRSYVWRHVGTRQDWIRDLVDVESDALVMRVTGRPTYMRYATKVQLSDHTSFTLPLRGDKHKTAVMSAIDQSGNVLVRYRMKGTPWIPPPCRWIEVVVSPDAHSLPRIELLCAVTAMRVALLIPGG
jgi:hypothetical protein